MNPTHLSKAPDCLDTNSTLRSRDLTLSRQGQDDGFQKWWPTGAHPRNPAYSSLDYIVIAVLTLRPIKAKFVPSSLSSSRSLPNDHNECAPQTNSLHPQTPYDYSPSNQDQKHFWAQKLQGNNRIGNGVAA